MARFRVRASGARSARRAFSRLPGDMRDVREEVAGHWAERTHTGAIADVPVDTGDLRAALEKRITSQGSSTEAEVGVWERDAYYARYVELGTSKMAAQPFLYPNARRADREIRGRLRDGVVRRVG